MSDLICNHTSVGMIIIKEKKMLLIERKKFPFGFAPPAGHVDEDESYEKAADRELLEEVGLTTLDKELLFKGVLQNKCRRIDGSWHAWQVYLVLVQGDIFAGKEEVKSYIWVGKKEIDELCKRSKEYVQKLLSEEDWIQNPGMEPVWVEMLDVILPKYLDTLLD